MSNSLNPGPPLQGGDESCEFDPPEGGEKFKAFGTAAGLGIAGAALQFGMAFGTGRLWSVSAIFMGGGIGWLVHLAAGRHRTVKIGLEAAGSAVTACVLGYALLWLPFVQPMVAGLLSWYYLVMTLLGGFVAYRLAGPKANDHLL